MAESGYYFILTVFFMLGFTVAFQQLFQVSQRHLIRHHQLQHSQLELMAATFVCLVMLLLRLLSSNLTGDVYWTLINLHLLLINYGVVMLESRLSFAMFTVVNAIVLYSTGAMNRSPLFWFVFVVIMGVFYVQHLRIRQFDHHPMLYAIYPSLVGPVIWLFLMAMAGSLYQLQWLQIGMVAGSYVVAMLVAVRYTLYVHRTRKIDSKFARQAKYDGLTGYKNWNAFRNEFADYFRQASEQQPLAIATLDIDKFKSINDQYGHLAGNQVLMTFTNLLVHAQREAGLTCENYRTGGEEFTILFPNTDIETARRVCDEWQEQVRQMTVSYGHHQIKLTVSVGLTQVRREDRTVTTTYQRADENLYQSKQLGRDRLTVS